MPREFGPSPEEMGVDVSKADSKNETKITAESGLDKTRKTVNSVMAEQKLNPEGRGSKVSIYGGKLVTESDGSVVYNMRGLVSTIDRIGDKILRAADDHTIKEPLKMAMRKPKAFAKRVFSSGKRFRTFDPQKMNDHFAKLGLSEYYEGHPDGIKIKNNDVLKKGYNLQDIYQMPELGIERVPAAGQAANYLRNLHDRADSGIGDTVVMDYTFMKKEGKEVSEPVLFLPNVIYDSEKKTAPVDQKATDLLEFLVSVGSEEYKASNDWDNVRKTLDTAVTNYHRDQDDNNLHNTLAIARSFIRRGRINMPGSHKSKIGETTTMHNAQHLQIAPEISAKTRELMLKSIDDFLKAHKVV
jgi:hypothetical protein